MAKLTREDMILQIQADAEKWDDEDLILVYNSIYFFEFPPDYFDEDR